MQGTILMTNRDVLSVRERTIADLAVEISTNNKPAQAIDIDRLRRNDLCEDEIQEVLKAAALFTYWNELNDTAAPTSVSLAEPPTLFDSTRYFFEGTH